MLLQYPTIAALHFQSFVRFWNTPKNNLRKEYRRQNLDFFAD